METWQNFLKQIGNFHVHTTFCDGKNSAEEMVCAAINCGFGAIGFSGHMPMSDNSLDWTMRMEELGCYYDEIARLREEYKDQIEILCGMEMDLYGDERCFDETLDFRIGSVHTVPKNGEWCEIDADPETALRNCKTVWGGDGVQYAVDYYAEVATVAKKTNCDIIGHFDLVTKFNEKDPLIDVSSPAIAAAEQRAMDELIGDCDLMEINTGAISRGWKKEPYPSLRILNYWRALGGRVILNGDSHSVDGIATAYKDGVMLAKAAGYDCVTVLTRNGEKEVKLPTEICE